MILSHRLPVALPTRAGVSVVAAYLACYLFLDWISFADPYGPLGITPWNPPPGLSIFMVLHYGPTMAPWLGVAALAAELLIRDVPAPWPVQLAACAWLAASYTAYALLLQRRLRFDPALATLRDATVFTGTTAIAALVIGMGFIGIFVAAGVVPPADFARTVGQFWIGDLIGIVVTTPLLLTLTRARATTPKVGALETVTQFSAIGIALFIVFGLGIGAELKLFYVLFLPLIWIAMRRGLAGTSAATLLVQVVLIAALMLGGHAAGQVLDFQFLMLALALTGLFLGVAVEERRAVERKLRDKQFELDRSLRAAAASELASALAHELNQPLSAVASYTRACQLLQERGDPQGELPAILHKVMAEANRAGTVVHRLREFVRSGTIRQECLPTARLLANAAEAAGPRAARHRVAIAVEVTGRIADVLGDRVQVETVLHNLIANAIDALKEAPGERRVCLTATDHDDAFVRIGVADNGPGLAPAARASLFEPFATHKADGLGLGLAISRTIVEAHGGALWHAQRDTGAAFCLTLPTAR
ncbi:MAG: MASE1 domain-containing protein [Burkholderiales bacterium]|nr:MASE1 domain-containing protein [Burkholderiales bacterium]